MAIEDTSLPDEVEEAWFGLQCNQVTSFRAEVARVIQQHQLDVTEARVKAFLDSIDAYAVSTLRTVYLLTLDPTHGAQWKDGVLHVIDDLHPQSVLTPLDLVRHHYRMVQRPLDVAQIVIRNTRSILYDIHAKPLAVIRCATVNPNRYPPDALRLKRAAALLEELTGEKIDWHRLVNLTQAEARCLDNTHWQLEME